MKNITQAPRYLFKYFPPARIDFLSTGLVRFSPPKAFNDPFEGVTRKYTPNAPPNPDIPISEWESAEIKKLMKLLSSDPKLPLSRRQLKVLATYLVRENFIRHLRMPEFHDSDMALMHLVLLPTTMRAELADIQRRLFATNGIFCLSEIRDSLLMWAHYAASHTGFVVEFDTISARLQSAKSGLPVECNLARVLYRDSLPDDFEATLEESQLGLVKSSHWSYEREWRAFNPLSNALRVEKAGRDAIHLFEIPLHSIYSIIFGCRSTPQFQKKVMSLISRNPQLSNVHFFQAKLDSSHFALQFDHLPNTSFNLFR